MTSNRIVKASKFAVFVASVIVSFVGSAVTQQGDITAAARGKVTVEASLADYYKDPGKLVNGHWKNERYLSASPTGPLSLDFTFGDTFIPGEDIVVTGLTFIVGGNGSNLWGSFAERMPKVFTVSGSNDGGATWTRIASYASFTSYAVSSDPAELHTYSGSMSFANWKSYRTYRIDIAEATGSTDYFVQLGEVAFLGFYGGTVVRPDPVKIDITAAARAAKAQAIESNAGVAGPSEMWQLANMVDGLYGYNNNRYLSNPETTKELWDAGKPVTIDYTIAADDVFAQGADVIVTAYTIDTDKAHGRPLQRMPKDWSLQGWDGTSWKTIDRMVGFADWQTVMHANEADQQEHEHWSYTFSITNSVSYRKYRLAVSKINDRANSNGDYVQFTELQLWGYVDAEIEGKVGLTADPHDLAITEQAYHTTLNPLGFVPVLTASQYDNTASTYAGTVDGLFNRNYADRFLARLGRDGDERAYFPFNIGYEIPQTYLTGKDIVITRYTIFSRTDLGQYQNRMPKTWKFQGLAPDGRWITIDKQTNFADWQTNTDNLRYYADFQIPDNKLAFRSYRLSVSGVSAPSTFESLTMYQLQLAEIELAGAWGMGIGGKIPPRQGLFVLVR